MSHSRVFLPLAAFALLLVSGCGETGSEEMEEMDGMEEPAEADMAPPSAAQGVSFVSPQDGETISGGTVQVVLEVTGLQVVEAGVMDPNTGHHHLYLDTDLTPLDAVIPAGVAGITHLGLAQTEYTFEGVAPGEHRLIAVVGNGAHIPLAPPVVDTVTFTVAAAP